MVAWPMEIQESARRGGIMNDPRTTEGEALKDMKDITEMLAAARKRQRNHYFNGFIHAYCDNEECTGPRRGRRHTRETRVARILDSPQSAPGRSGEPRNAASVSGAKESGASHAQQFG